MPSTIILAIVGSRNIINNDTNFQNIESRVLEWESVHGDIHSVISGGAIGIDKLAESFAKKHGKKMIIYYPDYQKYPGKIAPLIRNSQIVDAATHLIAFPTKDSRGTWDAVNKANKKGIPTTIYEIE